MLSFRRQGKIDPAPTGPARIRPTILLAVTLTALVACSCKSFKPHPPPPHPEWRGFLLKLRHTVLAAGEDKVWFKGTEFPPRPTDEPVDVLALPDVFRKVTQTMERESREQRLTYQTEDLAAAGRERVIEIRISHQGQLVSRWRVREVPRLYRAAIIIDDLGDNAEAAQKLLALPYPLTLSVLPHLRYSRLTAEEAYRAGREVMLHLPMEPVERFGIFAAPDQVKESMADSAVERLVRNDLDSIPHVRGVNNHMGSRATTDARLMAAVMQVLAQRHLYFIDSRTTGASVALSVARREDLPAFYRSVFLDDTASVSYTIGQLREFRRVIEEQGVALAIGHPHLTTIRALAEFLPEFRTDDIELLPVSHLVRLQQVVRLSPTHVGHRRPESATRASRLQ